NHGANAREEGVRAARDPGERERYGGGGAGHRLVLVEDPAVAEEARGRELELVAERARDRVPGEGGRARELVPPRLVAAEQEAVQARGRIDGERPARGVSRRDQQQREQGCEE